MKRVDPERMRRYLIRTLPPPEVSVTLSLREQEEQQAWSENWYRDNDPPAPYVVEWLERVKRFCMIKGLDRPTITIHDNPDMTKTISWETQ